jgi:hypothetical protein
MECRWRRHPVKRKWNSYRHSGADSGRDVPSWFDEWVIGISEWIQHKAYGLHNQVGFSAVIDVQTPPAIYSDCKPSYAIGLVMSYNRVNIICRMLGFDPPSHQINGCGKWTEGYFVMFLPKVERNITQSDQDDVRRHEEAHACGWSANHPR